jgi:hypothetical protein
VLDVQSVAVVLDEPLREVELDIDEGGALDIESILKCRGK